MLNQRERGADLTLTPTLSLSLSLSLTPLSLSLSLTSAREVRASKGSLLRSHARVTNCVGALEAAASTG